MDITAIEKPEIVFKNGVGYNSKAIYESLGTKWRCAETAGIRPRKWSVD
jgi:hypothetical protein